MSEEQTPEREDTFERLNYRGLISWSNRIERETPFFESALGGLPESSIVDLGCGTGEHARFFASVGFRSVGLDISAAQIAAAREYENEFGELGPRFFEADMLKLPELFERPFGAALCLGNVLPYMEDDELAPRLAAIASRLVDGGRFLFQILNYERIVTKGIRSLPTNVRPDPDGGTGELVWVRLMTPRDEKHVLFHPITLRYRPGEDPPVELDVVRERTVRAWRWEELKSLLQAAGFAAFETFGDMKGSPFEPLQSHDLIAVARLDASKRDD